MKLRNKLILSCAALAAVATTAVSTTFAWYTANTQVSANDFKAKTSNNGSDTLLISTDGKAGNWSNSITFTDEAKTLTPVQYNAATGANAGKVAGTYTAWSNSGATHQASGDGTAGVKTYTFYIKDQTTTESNTSIYVESITPVFANNSDYKPKDVLTTAGLGKDASNKDFTAKTYEVKLQRALDFEIAVVQMKQSNTSKVLANTDDELASGESIVDTALTADVFGFDKYSEITDSLTNRTGWNAHSYYNSALGQSISTTDPLAYTIKNVGASGQKVKLVGTVDAEAIYKVTVTIFVNGWDLACFDAVQGQNVEFDIAFNTTGGTAVTYDVESAPQQP